MAHWKFQRADGSFIDEVLDDGLPFRPSDELFDTSIAFAHAEQYGADVVPAYLDTPNYDGRQAIALRARYAEVAAAKAVEEKAVADAAARGAEALAAAGAEAKATDDARKAALKKIIDDELARHADPEAFAKQQAVAVINADHEAIVAQIGDDPETLAKAAALKEARLAELEAPVAAAPEASA